MAFVSSEVWLVEWENSFSHGDSWQDPEEHEYHTGTCRTVGFLIHKEPGVVTLAGSISVDGNLLGAISIPRSAVRKVTRWPS